MRRSILLTLGIFFVAILLLHPSRSALSAPRPPKPPCLNVGLVSSATQINLGDSVVITATLTNVCKGAQTVDTFYGKMGCGAQQVTWTDIRNDILIPEGQTLIQVYPETPACPGLWDFHFEADNGRTHWLWDAWVTVN